MRPLFKVVVAIVSALVTAVSLGFSTFNVVPKAPWSLIALISFVIFAFFVGWGWYRAEKSIRRLEGEAANPALQKAQDKHLEHVKELIEHWSNSLVIPPIHQVMPGTSATMHDLKDNPLFGCLKKHLPFRILWQNYCELNSKMSEYIDTCKKLSGQVHESWGIEGTESTPQFAIPILKFIAEERDVLQYQLSIDKGHALEEVKYQILVVDNTEVVRGIEALKGGQFQPLNGEQSGRQALAIEYQKIAGEFPAKDIALKANQLFQELGKLKVEMHNSLQEILERCDYIKHTCRLCPMKRTPTSQSTSRKEGFQT